MGMMAWFDERYPISCSTDGIPLTTVQQPWATGVAIEIPEIEEKKVIAICSYCGVEQEWQPYCIGCHAPLHRDTIIDDEDDDDGMYMEPSS